MAAVASLLWKSRRLGGPISPERGARRTPRPGPPYQRSPGAFASKNLAGWTIFPERHRGIMPIIRGWSLAAAQGWGSINGSQCPKPADHRLPGASATPHELLPAPHFLGLRLDLFSVDHQPG